MTGESNNRPWPKRLIAEASIKLLTREFWQEPLDQFARATHLGVGLLDARGALKGEIFNPQPLWSLLAAGTFHGGNGCPFSLSIGPACTCLDHVFNNSGPALVRDYLGLVHFAVPLQLGEHRLGAIMAGQVFDQHPETLPLERVAKNLQVRPAQAWELAQTTAPIRHSILKTYAGLLANLSKAWLQAGFNNFMQGRAEDELAGTHEQLRELTGKLLQVQDEERRHLARDLHDDFSQRLASLAITLHLALQAMPAELQAVSEHVNRARLMADSLADDMRDMAHELHPSALEHLGLPISLKSLTDNFADTYGIAVKCKTREFPASVPSEISVSLFRIAQEALQNVVKHAGRVPITLVLSGSGSGVRMMISDKGKGFDMTTRKPGLGLISMQERVSLMGGKLRITSTPGRGTSITVDVPLATNGES